MSDVSIVVKKTIYLPDELAEYIEQLSQKENRSFTGQVNHLLNLSLINKEPQARQDKENHEDVQG